MGTRGLDNLTEGRYHLLNLSEEANSGTATEGSGPRPFLGLKTPTKTKCSNCKYDAFFILTPHLS